MTSSLESGFLLMQLNCNQACNLLVRHLYEKQPTPANSFSTVMLAMDTLLNLMCDALLGKQGARLLDFIKVRQNEICAASTSLDECALETAIARRLNAQSLMYENAVYQPSGSKYLAVSTADSAGLDTRVRQMCGAYGAWIECAPEHSKPALEPECYRLIEAGVARAREMHLVDSKENQTPVAAVASPTAATTTGGPPMSGAALGYLPAYSFLGYCDSFAFDLHHIFHCMNSERKTLGYVENKESKQISALFEARLAAYYLHMLHDTGKYRWTARVIPLINVLSTLLLIKLLRLIPNVTSVASVPDFVTRYIYRYVPMHVNDASACAKRGVTPKVPSVLFVQNERERWMLQSLEQCPSAWFNLAHAAFGSRVRFAFYEPVNATNSRMEQHLKRAMEVTLKYRAGNESKAVDMVHGLFTGKLLKTSMDTECAAPAKAMMMDAVSVNVNAFFRQVKKRASMWAPECVYECFDYIESKEGALQLSPIIEDRTRTVCLHPIVTMLTMLEQMHPDISVSWESFCACYMKQQRSFISMSGY